MEISDKNDVKGKQKELIILNKLTQMTIDRRWTKLRKTKITFPETDIITIKWQQKKQLLNMTKNKEW